MSMCDVRKHDLVFGGETNRYSIIIPVYTFQKFKVRPNRAK